MIIRIKELSFFQSSQVVKNILFLFFVIFIFFAYIFNLDKTPANFHGDEAETAFQSVEILKGETELIGVGWFDLPLLSFIPHVLTMAIFGVNIFEDRLGSAIFGILSIPIFYLFIKLIFNNRTASIATILFATSHMWIALSRLGITYVQATFLMLTTFYFLFKAFKSEKKIYFILAGIFLGLSLYSYYAVRILPLIISIPLFFYLIKLKIVKIRLLNFSILVFFFFLTFLPQGLFFLKNPQTFSSRINAIYIFSKTGKEWTNYSKSDLEVLKLQFLSTINVFIDDNSTQYGYRGILFDYFTLFFSIIGILYSLILHKKIHVFLLFWFVLAILGQVLTTIPVPFFLPRFVIGLPIIFIFCALGFEFIFIIFARYKNVLNYLFILIITFIVIFNLNLYFIEYPKQLKQGIALTPIKIARFINSLPESYRIIFLTESRIGPGYGTIRFISQNKNTIDIENPSLYLSKIASKENVLGEKISINEDVNLNSAYIIYPEYTSKIDDLIKIYPKGKTSKIINEKGEIEFFTFKTN